MSRSVIKRSDRYGELHRLVFPGSIIPDDDPSSVNDRIIEYLNSLKDRALKNNFRIPICMAFGTNSDQYVDQFTSSLDFLDQESSDLLDIFMVGWEIEDQTGTFRFNIKSFISYRKKIREKVSKELYEGALKFVLLDIVGKDKGVYLDFTNTIQIDVWKLIDKGYISSPAELIQMLINEIRKIVESGRNAPSVFLLSDKIVVGTTKKSVWKYFLDKFGKVINAEILNFFVTRKITAEPIKIL